MGWLTTAAALNATRSSEPHVRLNRHARPRSAAWVNALRFVALPLWLSVPVLGVLAQPLAGRIVWTVLITGLPLLVVLIGYHRWRTICPLGWFSQLPARLGVAGRRRMPAWLEGRYYYLPLATFTACLWLRLIGVNGDGSGIALLFIGLTVAAVVCGFSTTGKTWCNYICPVSITEKLYTEPNSLRQTENSQCYPCTACKKACPDISQFNAYSDEMDLVSKRTAYFVYPGLVCGFYAYHFLRFGTWNSSLALALMDQPGVLPYAFEPGGFFFLPVVPHAVASLLTLLVCGGISWAAFERGVAPAVGWWLSRQQSTLDNRNVVLAIAAFTAFVVFYFFAWQLTFSPLDWAWPLALLVTIWVASVALIRRFRTPHPLEVGANATDYLRRGRLPRLVR